MKIKDIDWVTTLFLLLTPLASLILLPLYFYFFGGSYLMGGLFVVYWLCMSLTITAGYHRLFAHRSYKATKLYQGFLLFFGAGTFQGPALQWAADHRIHHNKVDSDSDPYSINKGFWYAHFFWMFDKSHPRLQQPLPPDLTDNKLIMFQHKHYITLAIASGFFIPTLIGLALGDALGGFLILGLLRIVVGHHTTFFINSLAHIWGSQPYFTGNTAKDNFVMAILTNGEGYHNFHHKFEADYRNGIRWYHWDPTKWFIQLSHKMGQAYQLKTVPQITLIKAKLKVQQEKIQEKGLYNEKLEALRVRIEQAQLQWKAYKKEYSAAKAQLSQHSKERLEQLKLDIKIARLEFKYALRQWDRHVRLLEG